MKRILAALALAASAAFVLASAACDDSSAVKEPAPDAGPGPGVTPPPASGADAGGDAGPDCFMNPKTHYEIINACTNATKITKSPNLPLLYPDGGLPPLN